MPVGQGSCSLAKGFHRLSNGQQRGCLQTTNLLLQAGAEALRVAPGGVPSLAPLRTIRELHRRTAAELGMGSREDIEGLLSEVQQLLVGISIMQVGLCTHGQTALKAVQQNM